MLKLEGQAYAGIFAGSGAWFAIYSPEGQKDDEFSDGQHIFSDQNKLKAFVMRNIDKPGCIVNCSTQLLDKLWQNSHVKAIINLNLKQGQAFDYICNRDHTIRWLYPSGLTYPAFLSLYNGTGWKASVYTAIFKLSFRLKLSHWVRHGQFHVQLKADAALSILMAKSPKSDLVAFTGTKGQNRKAVISFNNNYKAISFLKVPLTSDAAKLVQKERMVLTQLATSTPRHFRFPSILNTEDTGLHISNVKPLKSYAVSQLTDIHLLALQESYQLYQVPSSSIGESVFWQEIKANIASLADLKVANNLDPIKLDVIQYLLNKQFNAINANQELSLSLAHGDFTPWNNFFDGHKIHTYDWELADTLPLLYDAFHFIFQSSILVKREDFGAIKLQVAHLAQHPIVQSIIEQYQLDFPLCYKLYLLKTVAYYLPRYIQQEQLHEQAHWLLDIWLEALEE